MPLNPRQRLHAARRIRRGLLAARRHRRATVANTLQNAVSGLHCLESLTHRLGLATARDWTHAADRLTGEAQRLLARLSEQDAALRRATADVRPVPSLRAVHDDIQQIETEFVEVGYACNGHLLSAVTEPICLEGVYLGPFAIELSIDRLDGTTTQPIITLDALEPHPAMSNEAVTHPHVNDGVLCAGEGGAALRNAFMEGRLCDGFLIVRSVLNQYNPSSPYVALADWDGVGCDDCGATVPEDDTAICRSCDDRLCEGCSPACAWCDATTCHRCLRRCPVCEGSVCVRCLTTCLDCGGTLCLGCFERGCPCQQEQVAPAAENRESRREVSHVQ